MVCEQGGTRQDGQTVCDTVKAWRVSKTEQTVCDTVKAWCVSKEGQDRMDRQSVIQLRHGV